MGMIYVSEFYKNSLQTKKEIEEQVLSKIKSEKDCVCDIYSGTWAEKDNKVNFINKTFISFEEADDYISNHNGKWEPIDIAKVDSTINIRNKTILKRFNSLKERRLNEMKKENILSDEIDLIEKSFHQEQIRKIKNNKKTKFITCSHCKTRYMRKEIKSIFCLNCDKLLIPKANWDKYERKRMRTTTKYYKQREKLEKLKIKFEEFCEKNNIKIGWVAGGWCSC